MRLRCLLAIAALPIAASAQPLAFDAAPGALELAPVAQPTALRVALVVQRAEGSSCDGADCSDADCSPSGSDCSSGGGDDGAGCLVAGGCLVLAGGAGYGIYRWIQGRKPGPDSLAALSVSPGVRAFAEALSQAAEVTLSRTPPSEADVILTVWEETASRAGVGSGAPHRQLVVRASDGAGHPIALTHGSLPSARLSIPVDARFAERAHALLNGLAASGR